MKYGQLLVNTSMNKTCYRCFDYIAREDVMKFVRKFQKQHGDGWQITHVYRELLLGAHLCHRGYNARYNIALDSQTPDWSIFDKDQKTQTIIELASFHAPKEEEDEDWGNLDEKEVSFRWNSDNTNRLYSKIKEKTTHYKQLVERHKLSFVVAIFNQPFADIQPNEIQNCLFDKEAGIFNLYPELSGALFFREGVGNLFPSHYRFDYFENPQSIRKFRLEQLEHV
jgi:hypothetical protein